MEKLKEEIILLLMSNDVNESGSENYIDTVDKILSLIDEQAHLSVPSSDRVIKPFPMQDAEDIPLWLAKKVYERYEKLYGGTQSLERIGQRGGFYRDEVVALIKAI